MALIGPTYKGISLDIVNPFQNANELYYNRLSDDKKRIQEGMKALGTGIGDARKYFERKDALKELSANDAEIARLEKMLKDLDVEIANTKSNINAASNANIGLKKWNNIEERLLEGLNKWENEQNNPLMEGVDYNWNNYGHKSGLV